jgi:two-component system nitrate/nitrite response regulator NarL
MEGLRSLLEATGALRVVSVETSLIDAMDAARELRPSVIVLDKLLGTEALVDWLKAVRNSPEPPAAVVWGASIADSDALRFLHAGAAGVVRKTSALDTILRCIRTAADGGTWMEDDILSDSRRRERSGRSPLTARETQVMELVQNGLRNREIADQLGIRVGTVKIHIKHIFEKTGIHGRYGLAASLLRQRNAPTAIAV